MITALGDKLAGSHKVLLAAHREPDGDALGSTLGLCHLLEAQGKEVWAYSRGPVPAEFDFMPGLDKLRFELPQADWADVAVIMDCHQTHRVGPEAEPVLNAIDNAVVIDHHRGDAEYGDPAWIDPTYAATAQMVVDLAGAMDWEINAEAANCLFAGLQTDTGSFRYGNTTAEVMKAASILIEAGADVWAISQEIYATRPKRLKLLGHILDGMNSLCDGKVAIGRVSQAELEAIGAEPQDLENAVEALRGIPGVELAALVREKGDGAKVSMRSRGKRDVSALAISNGGGGHKNAAGMFLQKSLDEAAELVSRKLATLWEKA